MQLDNATELMAQIEWAFRKKKTERNELRAFYRAFCAVLNQRLEGERCRDYRVN